MAVKMIKVGDWDRARRALTGAAGKARRAVEKANKQEAHLFRALVNRAFVSRGRSNGKAWPKLSPVTIAKKGSTKPLIDSGQLKSSIVVVRKGDTFFIGVPHGTLHSDRGKRMTQIAHVHEFGHTIVQGSRVIRIPERSFLRATRDFHYTPAKYKARMENRIGRAMGKDWLPKTARMSDLAKEGVKVSKGK